MAGRMLKIDPPFWFHGSQQRDWAKMRNLEGGGLSPTHKLVERNLKMGRGREIEEGDRK